MNHHHLLQLYSSPDPRAAAWMDVFECPAIEALKWFASYGRPGDKDRAEVALRALAKPKETQ